MQRLFSCAALILGLVVAGCAILGAPAPETPAERVLALKAVYRTALGIAIDYKTLPSCAAPVHPVICSDAGVVAKIQEVDNTVFPLVTAAQAAVDDPAANPTTLAGSIVLAQRALDALTALTATLRVQ